MGYPASEGVGIMFVVLATALNLLGGGIGIALYVLDSLGLYSIAKRRKLSHPGLAWVPVARVWTVGSLSDQYRYVKNGQVRNKRKWLLILECLMVVMIFATVILMVINAFNLESSVAYSNEDAYLVGVVSLILQFLLLWLGGMALLTARAIIHYMAMYDIYTSLDPAYSVVFLLLSIFVPFAAPFLLFFNRKKDLGMPPRNDAPPVAYAEEA